jgi:hypothetical protein
MIRVIAIRSGVAIALVFSIVAVFSTTLTSLGAQPKPAEAQDSAKTWVMPDTSTIPAGPLGDSIRLGMQIFNGGAARNFPDVPRPRKNRHHV